MTAPEYRPFADACAEARRLLATMVDAGCPEPCGTCDAYRAKVRTLLDDAAEQVCRLVLAQRPDATCDLWRAGWSA